LFEQDPEISLVRDIAAKQAMVASDPAKALTTIATAASATTANEISALRYAGNIAGSSLIVGVAMCLARKRDTKPAGAGEDVLPPTSNGADENPASESPDATVGAAGEREGSVLRTSNGADENPASESPDATVGAAGEREGSASPTTIEREVAVGAAGEREGDDGLFGEPQPYKPSRAARLLAMVGAHPVIAATGALAAAATAAVYARPSLLPTGESVRQTLSFAQLGSQMSFIPAPGALSPVGVGLAAISTAGVVGIAHCVTSKRGTVAEDPQDDLDPVAPAPILEDPQDDLDPVAPAPILEEDPAPIPQEPDYLTWCGLSLRQQKRLRRLENTRDQGGRDELDRLIQEDSDMRLFAEAARSGKLGPWLSTASARYQKGRRRR
jgi:hypothetical protein